MLNVKVVKDQATVISWGGPTAQKPDRTAGSMRRQEVWVQFVAQDGTPDPYPSKLEITLADERRDESGNVTRPRQEPYAKGDYTLHPSAVYVDLNGRLAITPRLTPIVKRAA